MLLIEAEEQRLGVQYLNSLALKALALALWAWHSNLGVVRMRALTAA